MIAKNIRVEKRVITRGSDSRGKKWQVVFDGYYPDGTLYQKSLTQYTDTKWEARSHAASIERYGY